MLHILLTTHTFFLFVMLKENNSVLPTCGQNSALFCVKTESPAELNVKEIVSQQKNQLTKNNEYYTKFL